MIQFSKEFSDHLIEINNTSLFFRYAGSKDAPLVLLIHGHTQSSDMWGPLANVLVADGYQVIAVDMHGLGRSGAAQNGCYDKKTIAFDFNELIKHLDLIGRPTHIVGHDLGAFAAYAYAAQFAKSEDSLIMMDAIVPGLGDWSQLLQQPRTWHFGFYGPHAERLIDGRERIYLDRFWDEFAIDSSVFSSEMREFYAGFYRQSGALTTAFGHFSAFEQDEKDNQVFANTKLTIPVLGLGGEHSLGPILSGNIGLLAESFETVVIEDSGHWLIEENPEQTIAETRNFLSNIRV